MAVNGQMVAKVIARLFKVPIRFLNNVWLMQMSDRSYVTKANQLHKLP